MLSFGSVLYGSVGSVAQMIGECSLNAMKLCFYQISVLKYLFLVLNILSYSEASCHNEIPGLILGF